MELDSMDFLDIVMELRKRYRIQIPEEDYPHLATMAAREISRTDHEGHVGVWKPTAKPRASTSPSLSVGLQKIMLDTIIIGAGMSE